MNKIRLVIRDILKLGSVKGLANAIFPDRSSIAKTTNRLIAPNNNPLIRSL